MTDKDPATERKNVLGFASKIPWESYIGIGKRSGEAVFLDADDVKLIRRFANESPAAMTELLTTDEDARSYPMALLKVLTNITDVRVVQYALTIAEDFLAADPSARAKYFLRPVSRSAGAGSADRKTFFTPFLQLVGTTGSGAVIASKDANPYVLERAAACASLLLSVDCSDAHATPAMLAWVFTHIRAYGSTDPKQVKVTEVAVTSLRTLLRNDVLRKLFVLERGVEWLVPLLTARNTQLLYDSVFCIWSLSLDPAYTKTLETTGAVTAVSHLARANMPLKLVRVAFALIANVLRDPACADSLAEICETQIPETIESLLAQDPKITDPELLDDLHYVRDSVRSNRRKLTNVERYEKELKARKFEWTSLHNSDFWKENATKFEADGFKLLGEIRDLVKDPEVQPETLAVAVADLGEFAVAHPQGRSVLQALGVRPVVMALLKHENEEVRQQALMATSKLLVTRWEFVSSPHAATMGSPTGTAAKA